MYRIKVYSYNNGNNRNVFQGYYLSTTTLPDSLVLRTGPEGECRIFRDLKSARRKTFSLTRQFAGIGSFFQIEEVKEEDYDHVDGSRRGVPNYSF